MRGFIHPHGAVWPGIVLLSCLAGCAGPPAKFYTLGAPAIAAGAVPVGDVAISSMPIVLVSRVALPDYLDTQDIVRRRGDQIDRSREGRWTSRLSIGATELITARLAMQRPDMLVTSQPQYLPPTYRLAIDISRLDISDDGTASLDANWTIVPINRNAPLRRGRVVLQQKGKVATDADVVALTDSILDSLARRIGQDFRSMS